MSQNKWRLCLCFSLVMILISCSKSNSDSNESSEPSSVNLTMTSDDFSWETENVIIYDQGLRTLHLHAVSIDGGSLDLGGITYMGIGIFDATDIASETWSLQVGTGVDQMNYVGGTDGPINGTITILDHDLENDLISGSFDVILANEDDISDVIHVEGSFSDLVLTPAHPTQTNTAAVVNDSSFVYDYAMIFQQGDFMYLEMVNNIDEIVTVRWDRNTLAVDEYDVTQQAPIRVHYRNGSQIFTQQVSGAIEVLNHNSDSPGQTEGSYVLVISDFGSPPQYLEGSFAVSYN